MKLLYLCLTYVIDIAGEEIVMFYEKINRKKTIKFLVFKKESLKYLLN